MTKLDTKYTLNRTSRFTPTTLANAKALAHVKRKFGAFSDAPIPCSELVQGMNFGGPKSLRKYSTEERGRRFVEYIAYNGVLRAI